MDLSEISLNLEMDSAHRDKTNLLARGTRMLKSLVRPDPGLASRTALLSIGLLLKS